MSWKNKVVLVTGGSSGLGSCIAKSFSDQGANLAIIGRNQERLDDAVVQLEARGKKAIGIRADVTDEQHARKAIDQAAQHYGRLDVLVNNVGKSIRTDLLKTTLDDYRQQLEINFLSAVCCTQFALAALRENFGHVVNIGSLASKTAWPFLSPYSASKFALASFTHQLRLEGPSEIHYMLVCPGPILRSDAGTRYNDQAEGLPEYARQPAAGAKIRGMDPMVLARRIIRGCERRQREIIPFRARVVFAMLALSPPLGDWMLRLMMKD